MSSTIETDIMDKVNTIANMISKKEEVEFFKQAERKLKSNKQINDLIELIKKKQKELVNAKHLNKSNYIQLLELELDELNKELNDIPLVQQYQQSLAEVNHYMQSTIQLIKNSIKKDLPIE